MLKLLICLFGAMVLAVLVLQMRQQQLGLSYQNNKLHRRIEESKARLWNQQMRIAVHTAPNAIAATVGDQELHMVPASPLPGQTVRWIERKKD